MAIFNSYVKLPKGTKSPTEMTFRRLWRCPPPPPAPRRRAAAPGAASPRWLPGAPPGLGLRRLRPGPGEPGGAWGSLGEPGGAWGMGMGYGEFLDM